MQPTDLTALLDAVSAQSLTLAADGADLVVSGAELPEELRATLIERKEELLAHLKFPERAGQLLLEVVGRLAALLGERPTPPMPEPVAQAYATMAAAHDTRAWATFEEAVAAFEAAWMEALSA